MAPVLAGYDGATELDRSLDTPLAGPDAQLSTRSGTAGINDVSQHPESHDHNRAAG